jgi:hypothetical protein
MSPVRWTCKNMLRATAGSSNQAFDVSRDTVAYPIEAAKALASRSPQPEDYSGRTRRNGTSQQ